MPALPPWPKPGSCSLDPSPGSRRAAPPAWRRCHARRPRKHVADRRQRFTDGRGKHPIGRGGEQRLFLIDQRLVEGHELQPLAGMDIPAIAGKHVPQDELLTKDENPELAIQSVRADEIDEFGQNIVAATGAGLFQFHRPVHAADNPAAMSAGHAHNQWEPQALPLNSRDYGASPRVSKAEGSRHNQSRNSVQLPGNLVAGRFQDCVRRVDDWPRIMAEQ